MSLIRLTNISIKYQTHNYNVYLEVQIVSASKLSFSCVISYCFNFNNIICFNFTQEICPNIYYLIHLNYYRMNAIETHNFVTNVFYDLILSVIYFK